MNLAMPLLKKLSHVKHLYTMVLLNPKTLLVPRWDGLETGWN